jgi:hypothetical protein
MKMCFRRKSQITGVIRDRYIEVEPEELARYNEGALVQDAFPNLTPGEREFIITGITEEEWAEFMGIEEE